MMSCLNYCAAAPGAAYNSDLSCCWVERMGEPPKLPWALDRVEMKVSKQLRTKGATGFPS